MIFKYTRKIRSGKLIWGRERETERQTETERESSHNPPNRNIIFGRTLLRPTRLCLVLLPCLIINPLVLLLHVSQTIFPHKKQCEQYYILLNNISVIIMHPELSSLITLVLEVPCWMVSATRSKVHWSFYTDDMSFAAHSDSILCTQIRTHWKWQIDTLMRTHLCIIIHI